MGEYDLGLFELELGRSARAASPAGASADLHNAGDSAEIVLPRVLNSGDSVTTDAPTPELWRPQPGLLVAGAATSTTDLCHRDDAERFEAQLAG